ncbi:MAG: CHASE2 domain-containing protein [Erythrobacter sp.]
MKRQSVQNWTTVALVVLLVGLASQAGAWDRIARYSFDALATLAAPRPTTPGAIIVAIDEPSMAALGEQWPWPRSRHAALVAALREAGAKAIAFDIVFAEPSKPEEDAALRQVGGADLVLAADDTIIERDFGAIQTRTEPAPQVLGQGTRIGVASLTADSDGGLRFMPRYGDSLAAQLMRATGREPPVSTQGAALIQYFGPAGSYPTVSYYQALEPDRYLPPAFFRDQAVIIGFALQAGAEVEAGGVDAFVTPYTAATGMLTAGAEVQATIFDNLRTGLAIGLPPPGSALVFIAFAGVLALAPLSARTLSLRTAATLAVLVGLVLVSWLALRFGRLWLSPVEPAAAFAFVSLGIGINDFAAERARRREVLRAFGHYVAPDVVRQIVANPGLLNLGGEKREMTILFADIRGFTTICEAMKDDPVGLTQLINAILAPLSDIVIANRGTIDKYMGDCIMAFWNAPLDDPDHALHAISAGEAMLGAMGEINAMVAARLPAKGAGANVRIGIGINSGECVVGNMGSATRFDYSVLGDPVNIAARLESLCKTYDVPLVVGAATVAAVGSRRAFRLLDTIAVRGRNEAQPIYTIERA